MVARNKALNKMAMKAIGEEGVHVPESVAAQADYDAEEAELQRAIAESKAMMEEETNNKAIEDKFIK